MRAWTMCKTVEVLLVLVASFCISDVRGACSNITTFNAGLTNAVANVDSRLPLIQDAILENNADVMCLQEVWYERALTSIIGAVGSTYPHHYSAIHARPGKLRIIGSSWLSWFSPDAPCTASEVSYLVTDVLGCAARKFCTGGSAEKIGSCMAKRCKAELKSTLLSQSCLSCMMFSISALTDTVTECARVVGANNRFNGPGLVLLSKKPMRRVRYVNYHRFSKTMVERGYIEADIDDVGKVVCTHLSARFNEYFEFDTNFRNYEQQQAYEIRTLSRFWYKDHILLGDLNTGPALNFTFDPRNSMAGSYPKNYETLMSYGYRDPYEEQVRRCTYCSVNRLTKGPNNYMLDHILAKGQILGAIAERVMTSHRRRYISDHFGVGLRFCKTV